MHKHYIIFLAFLSMLIGQGALLDMEDMEDMTNDRLDDIREQLKTDPLADTRTVVDPDIETLAIEIDREAAELEKELSELSEYFGYGYFKRKINFFDNVPTPIDFKLGAGDEIILSLWGQVNLQEKFTINKDGLIYYKNIGFINLANKTIDEAELILIDKLSQTYSTIKNTENSTNVMLELGKLRSVNVYFSGQISNPGIHVIHPFSDIFSAIIQADGIKVSGSLRNVQLIRDRKIIHTIDFYDFFTNGKSDFSNIRILEGDVIHIPQVENRSEILGAIHQPGYYELRPNELLSDLIKYAGGVTVNAADTIMLDWVVPISKRSSIDDTQRELALTMEDAQNFVLNAGSTVHVESVRAMATGVLVYGRVKNPGYYPASKSLKEVLDLAGGFNDPFYVQSIRTDEIKILRRDGSQFYGSEFNISYKESDTFDLFPDDKVFVYEDSKYRNIPTVRIEGEVNRSGTFPFKQGMTIQDVIDLAEGFTPFANHKGVILFDEWEPLLDKSELDEKGIDHSPLMQDPVANITPEFQIAENAFIQVLPLKNHVLVEGAVYRPGLVTYTGPKSVNFYLKQAGGATSEAEFKDSYLMRANGKIKTLNRRNQKWVKVEPGDQIWMPINTNPSEFNATEFTASIVNILTNLATIIFIIDSNTD
tara:strand:- start:3156 stop:5105 length:1950 start_codon:yes stop_codon:yes gene_type:complete